MKKTFLVVFIGLVIVVAGLYIFDGTRAAKCTEFVPSENIMGEFNPETGEHPTVFRWNAPYLEKGIPYPLEGSWIWSKGEIWDVPGRGPFVRVHPTGQDAGWVPATSGTFFCK